MQKKNTQLLSTNAETDQRRLQRSELVNHMVVQASLRHARNVYLLYTHAQMNTNATDTLFILSLKPCAHARRSGLPLACGCG